jgi:uncharacterized membrane protein
LGNPAGQASVTAMAGAVMTWQMAVGAVFVAVVDVQRSLPVALKVLETQQALAGTL